MAVGCTGGSGVGLGSVVAVGAAVAAGSSAGRFAAFGNGGGELVGALVAIWPGGVDAAVVAAGNRGATVSAGRRAVAVGGGVAQAKTNPNIAGKTMIEIARSKIALFIQSPRPACKAMPTPGNTIPDTVWIRRGDIISSIQSRAQSRRMQADSGVPESACFRRIR